METNTAIRLSALMAQDEKAVKYRPQCILAGGRDSTLDPSQ